MTGPDATRGALFRAHIAATYSGEPTPTQAVLIDRAASLLDRIEAIERSVAANGVMAVGSRGQARSNGALIALAEAERVLLATLKDLALPDPDAPAPKSRGGRRVDHYTPRLNR
ncbi:hypothetical protein ACFOYW_13380 [Gryllotalpicola reticulitermitis]|uniref:Uncharacterized protein n=1 Tax=Gryllotalpicola reticulitermitis TaxID=1184153 RepID=A0ABV8Q7N7_9MICO